MQRGKQLAQDWKAAALSCLYGSVATSFTWTILVGYRVVLMLSNQTKQQMYSFSLQSASLPVAACLLLVCWPACLFVCLLLCSPACLLCMVSCCVVWRCLECFALLGFAWLGLALLCWLACFLPSFLACRRLSLHCVASCCIAFALY